MAEHLKKSQAELNELLTEYWRLRHETGGCKCQYRHLPAHFRITDVYMETLANKLGMQVTSS